MSEEAQNTPFPDETNTPGAPVDSPTGETAGPPETDADAVQPPGGGGYRRREFLGITVKVLAGAAVGLHAGDAWAAQQGGVANQAGGAGIGNTITICNAANPNRCQGVGLGGTNVCIATHRNICVGPGANLCTPQLGGGNTCEPGGNECLSGANANTCNRIGANTCKGSAGLIGNECKLAQGANTCQGSVSREGNTCEAGPHANVCKQAGAANTCAVGPSYNICTATDGNTCHQNGASNTCNPSSSNQCSPSGFDVALASIGGSGTEPTYAALRLRDVLALLGISVV